MRFLILYLILIFLFFNCVGKDEESSKTKEVKQSRKYVSSSGPEKKTKSPEEKKREYEKTEKPGKGDDFFKGGFKTVKGEKAGVYIVVKGDCIWDISEKYLLYYKESKTYSRTNHGNVAYVINKFNYDHLYCGINDEININEKVYVPIDYIERVEEESRKLRERRARRAEKKKQNKR